MKRLYFTILTCLCFLAYGYAQQGTFIALDNAGNLYRINILTCAKTKLNLCTNTVGNPLSIALDSNKLYINDNKGNLYVNTLGTTGTTGNCTLLGKFKSASTAIYGLTVGPNGIVYAASGNLIETYNPTTGVFGTLGSLPATYLVGGDLLFYKNELYEACQNAAGTSYYLVKVNLANPAASTIYMNFNSGSNIFGFAGVTQQCSNNQTYAVSRTGDIYAVDLVNKTQSTTVKCSLGITINDAASVAETTIDSKPPTPSNVTSPINVCVGSSYTFTVTPTVTATDPNDTLRWYVSTSTLPTGTPKVNTATPSSTTYLVSQYNPNNGCESDSLTIILNVRANPSAPSATASTPNCAAAATVTATITGTVPNLGYTINGTTYTASNIFTNVAGGIYNVRVKDTLYGCVSPSTAVSVIPQPLSPIKPTISPATVCEETSPTFTASNASLYQFFKNGVPQTNVSANNTYAPGVIKLKDTIKVRSYAVPTLTFDGNITESFWGPPIATSAGGPSSGFATKPEINALYVRNNIQNVYLAVAGSVHNDERILVFIDSKTGGYSNGNFGRLNAPLGLYDYNQNNQFDAGFNPDYVLAFGTNPTENNYYADLYTLSGFAGSGGGPNKYLGDAISSTIFGANSATGSNTKGFEIAFPWTDIAYDSAFGNLKLMVMYVKNDGTISNQFITRANAGENDYGKVVVNFANAAPNPVIFTPDPNCYEETIVAVTSRTKPTFSIAKQLCFKKTPPTLPTTSNEGISGTWSPATVDNTVSADYIFTPNASECAWKDTLSITITPRTKPTFNPINPFCFGSIAPKFPTSSIEGFTGTWSPSVIDNKNSGVYFFTPDTSLCADTASITITIIQKTTPTFPAIAPFCKNSIPPILPTTSNEGFTGNWTPARIDSSVSGSYSFQLDAGQCANPVTINITIPTTIKPTFTAISAICKLSTPPSLPAQSIEGIAGNWSPSSIDSSKSGYYYFTPTGSTCADTASLYVDVTDNATPTFTPIAAICKGSSAPVLPNQSLEGFTGYWIPAKVDSTQSGNYLFMPNLGQCALAGNISVTVKSLPTSPTATLSIPTCSDATTITVSMSPSVPDIGFSINGTSYSGTNVFTNVAGGSYNLTAKDTISGCVSPATILNVTPQPITPPTPVITPASVCEGSSPTFTATNGGLYQFFKNGVAQTSIATTNTYSPGVITTKDTIKVRTYVIPPVTFDGNINESFWGNPLATSAGGPASGFATKPEINALYARNNIQNLYVALAGSVHNDERILVFIDSKTGGYNDGNFGRLGAPLGLYDYNQANTFDAGFNPDYVLAFGTNPAENNYYADLYTLSGFAGSGGGPNKFLGDATTSSVFGAISSTGTISKGFEVAFPLADIAYDTAFGNIKLMAMYVKNDGTISNQFISRANAGENDYGKVVVDFSKAAPNPVSYAPSISCYAETLVTVNPSTKPTFNIPTQLCFKKTPPVLPTSSIEGITGTWTPSAVDSTFAGTYIFTPATGSCAFNDTVNITIVPRTKPTFTQIPAFCRGSVAQVLPSTSLEGITGNWLPNVIDTTKDGVYLFTPDAALCADTVYMSISVTQKTTPTFTAIAPFCEKTTPPLLPAVSLEGITGTWNPAKIDSTQNGVYTFTPDAGQCATITTLSITLTPKIKPSFAPINVPCNLTVIPNLPATSLEGIAGTWNPSVISTIKSGYYSFTPDAGPCADTSGIFVLVTNQTKPTFPVIPPICGGSIAPILPTVSNEGITGTWSPATINNTTSGNYVFTPTAGICAETVTISITVNTKTKPTFAAIAPICNGDIAPILPTTSIEGIPGSWNPTIISNTASGNYLFTNANSVCADTVTISVTVNPKTKPTFAAIAALCKGAAAPNLPTISKEGIAGTWNPATVSNTLTGKYLFTPTAGICADTVWVQVQVDTLKVPTFNPIAAICEGSTLVLPTTSLNSVNGIWSPAPDNSQTTTYLFTPTGAGCAATVNLTVTVNKKLSTTFNPISAICNGTTPPILPATSLEGFTGSWTPSVIDNTKDGTYQFTLAAGQCALAPAPITVQIQDKPILPTIAGPTYVAVGEFISLSANVPNGLWSNTPATIATINTNGELTGLVAGTTTVKYKVSNTCGDTTAITQVEVTTPSVFIPNTFSPNGDGKNDLFYVRGNTNIYKMVELRIFNQWGNLLYENKGFVDDPNIAWNGTQNGKAQPAGVYIYVAKVTDKKGDTFVKKGAINLIR